MEREVWRLVGEQLGGARPDGWCLRRLHHDLTLEGGTIVGVC